MKRLVALLLLVSVPATTPADAAQLSVDRTAQQDVMVTVYNGNLGLVKDVRDVQLPPGLHEVHYADVASLIDPTSVHLRSITDPAGLRILELPRAVGTLQSRTQFSGTTGLTSAGDSDGQRDLYRLPDGRLLIVIQYPDPAGSRVAVRGAPNFSVRGVPAERVESTAASLPLAIAWGADGMRYQVGGAGFGLDELQRYAELLR